MATAVAPPTTNLLHEPELKARLQRFRQPDNLTNWYYVLRTYLYLAVVLGGTIWFYEYQAAAGLSFWWNVPARKWVIVATRAMIESTK